MSEVFTADEVKKALECCSEYCENAHLRLTYQGEPFQVLLDKTINLINHYEAEINRLNTELKATSGAALSYKEESERYKGVIKILEKDVAEAKAEGFKEFAEQFKTSAKGMPYEGWLRYKIDIMLKERAGENNA